MQRVPARPAASTPDTSALCAGYQAVTAAYILRAATSRGEVLENKASADVTITGQVGKDEAHQILLWPCLTVSLPGTANVTTSTSKRVHTTCSLQRKGSKQHVPAIWEWTGCQHEHEWEAQVRSRCRFRQPAGCPFCSSVVVCPCNSLAELQPTLLQYWDVARNAFPLAEPLHPAWVGVYSNRKVWWRHDCTDGQVVC